MFRSKRIKTLTLSVLGSALTCVFVLSAIVAIKAYAAEKPVRTIVPFLADKKIDYSDVQINERTLSIKLLSSGEDRCTLDDVKAIMAIYEAIHAQSIEGQVKNVSIGIYNDDGVLIYDTLENGVDSPVENIEQLVTTDPDQKRGLTTNDVLQKVDSIISDFSYSIQQSQITESTEISGRKLQLTLCENNNDISSIDDVRAIYENLEAYSLASNAITQCEIVVTNRSGNCVLFMAGDFLYGNCIAWISPEIENSFTAREGPKY